MDLKFQICPLILENVELGEVCVLFICSNIFSIPRTNETRRENEKEKRMSPVKRFLRAVRGISAELTSLPFLFQLNLADPPDDKWQTNSPP